MAGQNIGYIRVSTVEQNTARQLDGVALDKTFTDRVSGKSILRPQLRACLDYVRDGDTLHVHSMDRLARNLDDLRKLVKDMTGRGVRVQFHKENLIFTGDDSPMANLLLNLLGSVAAFEVELLRERQREGVALAKAAGKYRGGKPKLADEQVQQLQARVAAGVAKAKVAREFGITRQTLYSYLVPRRPHASNESRSPPGPLRPRRPQIPGRPSWELEPGSLRAGGTVALRCPRLLHPGRIDAHPVHPRSARGLRGHRSQHLQQD